LDRAQKQHLVEALQQDLADTGCVVVTHQTGLNVAEATQLRRQVRGAGASFRVTKNRLARRALAGTAFEPLAPLFTGPTAIAFSRDPLAAAKVVVEFANRNNKLTVIGGGLAGRQLDAGQRAGEPASARRAARQTNRPASGSCDAAGGRSSGARRTARAGSRRLCRAPSGGGCSRPMKHPNFRCQE
jgi:ribosomal L10-like protein